MLVLPSNQEMERLLCTIFNPRVAQELAHDYLSTQTMRVYKPTEFVDMLVEQLRAFSPVSSMDHFIPSIVRLFTVDSTFIDAADEYYRNL
jgi:hypothetical protein